MKQENTLQPTDDTRRDDTPSEQQDPRQAPATHHHNDDVAQILHKLGVSESTAITARAIIDSVEKGKKPGESFVRLIVNAINHDEDIKNAEAEGYRRGRNEEIEAASKLTDDQQPTPVNFPVYRRRSFWDS